MSRGPGRRVTGDGATPGGGPGRFPGFDVMAQLPPWDRATAAVVESRLGPPPPASFFSPAEEAAATALLTLILGQEKEPRVPVTAMIDERLAGAQTDGWRYADMPEDGQAWRDTLACLDADARLEQLGPWRRRVHGPLRRLHPALPSQRLPALTQDGVGADWPLSYGDLLPYYRAIEEELPVAGEHWPWGDPHGYPHRPHPVGGNGEVFLRGARKLGITAKVGPVAIPNGRFGNRPHCIYRGFCLQGCKVNAKASPLISHIPDARRAGRGPAAGRRAWRPILRGSQARTRGTAIGEGDDLAARGAAEMGYPFAWPGNAAGPRHDSTVPEGCREGPPPSGERLIVRPGYQRLSTRAGPDRSPAWHSTAMPRGRAASAPGGCPVPEAELATIEQISGCGPVTAAVACGSAGLVAGHAGRGAVARLRRRCAGWPPCSAARPPGSPPGWRPRRPGLSVADPLLRAEQALAQVVQGPGQQP